MKETLLTLGIVAGVLTACGETGADYVPVVDGARGVNFESDLRACQTVAQQKPLYNDEAREDALIGAGLGALLALGEGDAAEAVVAAAAIGGVAGAGAGALENHDDRADIVIECMQGRGHNVVG